MYATQVMNAYILVSDLVLKNLAVAFVLYVFIFDMGNDWTDNVKIVSPAYDIIRHGRLLLRLLLCLFFWP